MSVSIYYFLCLRLVMGWCEKIDMTSSYHLHCTYIHTFIHFIFSFVRYDRSLLLFLVFLGSAALLRTVIVKCNALHTSTGPSLPPLSTYPTLYKGKCPHLMNYLFLFSISFGVFNFNFPPCPTKHGTSCK